MVTIAVLAYLLLTVGIGLFASRRVHGSKDFMVAGRSLPLVMTFTCVFATWFGAETVLSVSATFAKDGLSEIPGDPFGFSVCLILVGVFFARVFYRMNLLTIGDFYHQRYGKLVEVFTSIVITMSYLGWAAAQLTALGLVLSVLGQSAGYQWMTLDRCIVLGSFVVMLYTTLGGMWSVALTDLIQTFVIIVGLIIIAVLMADLAGGFGVVVESAYNTGRLRLLPNEGAQSWWVFIGGFLTAALGSIPQQDVFQRVTSAKDEKTAVAGTLLGGAFYFVFAFVPMFIAYSAIVIDSSYEALFASDDERQVQRILPELILAKTPFWAQVIFLGALVSAILSTASGTLLAPSSLFVENVMRPFATGWSDQRILRTLRIVMVLFAVGATLYAISNEKTMYEMVKNAYSVPLVGALVPLVMGIYWRRATTQGAIGSILAGVIVWLVMLLVAEDFIVPPQLCGLAASFVGMLLGSLLPQWITTQSFDPNTMNAPEDRAA